jgi:hypothetical protein
MECGRWVSLLATRGQGGSGGRNLMQQLHTTSRSQQLE